LLKGKRVDLVKKVIPAVGEISKKGLKRILKIPKSPSKKI
jgi:hypothetical protein